MASVEGFLEDFAKGGEFCGMVRFEVRIQDAWIGADLPEAKELAEGGEFDLGISGAGHLHFKNLFFGIGAHFLVEKALRGRHFAIDDLLKFFGQFGGDGGLGAAENIGCGLGEVALVEPLAVVAIGSGRDGGEVPGMRKAKRLRRSSTAFSMGVPVRIKRPLAERERRALEAWVRRFFTCWASSARTMAKERDWRRAWSRTRVPYEVTRTS